MSEVERDQRNGTMMQLRNLIHRFKSETDGNVSLMFAISFVASMSLIGAVFDLALLNKSKQHAQYLTDAAALAALQFDGSIKEKEAVFRDYIQALAEISGEGEAPVTEYVNIEVSDSALIIDAQVSVPHELILLQHLEGFDSISLTTQAQKGIEDIEIALVLDISSSMNGVRIVEAKRAANLFIEQLLTDQTIDGRVAISLVPFGGTVRVPSELSSLLDTPLSELKDYSHNWIDGKWNQCFEFDISDTEKGINPDGAYRVTPDFWSWNRTNPWCPTSGNELVALNNDKDALSARVNALTLSDGTGSDHGMAWGVETLDPKWKNKFPGGLKDTPANLDDKTKKVIVFMSDGAITSQHYVRDSDKTGAVPYNSKRRVLIPARDTREAFYGACDRAKANDMEVFTIGFNLTRDSHRSYLENCASSSLHYIDARTGDLDEVFGDIANEISPLRVSN